MKEARLWLRLWNKLTQSEKGELVPPLQKGAWRTLPNGLPVFVANATEEEGGGGGGGSGSGPPPKNSQRNRGELDRVKELHAEGNGNSFPTTPTRKPFENVMEAIETDSHRLFTDEDRKNGTRRADDAKVKTIAAEMKEMKVSAWDAFAEEWAQDKEERNTFRGIPVQGKKGFDDHENLAMDLLYAPSAPGYSTNLLNVYMMHLTRQIIPEAATSIQEIGERTKLDAALRKWGKREEALSYFLLNMKDRTDKALKLAGYKPGDKITLMRGVSFAEGDKDIPAGIKFTKYQDAQGNWQYHHFTEMEIGSKPYTSFTTDPDTALRFGILHDPKRDQSRHSIMVVEIPVERILSTSKTGFGFTNEQEVLALGSASDTHRIVSWWGYNDPKRDPPRGIATARVNPRTIWGEGEFKRVQKSLFADVMKLLDRINQLKQLRWSHLEKIDA